jgi:hypothetical protein
MPFEFLEHRGTTTLIVAKGVIYKEDADQLRRLVTSLVEARTGGDLLRFLCDCREFKIYAPDAAEALTGVMKRLTPHIAKAAFVVAIEGAGALQMKRMIREAGSDKRRVFTTMVEAEEWLAEP